MINQKAEFKTKRKQHAKLVFSILLIIHISGICTGCLYAMKNGQNLQFISNIIVVESIQNMTNTAILGRYIKQLIRDSIYLTLILIFKYSGVLKGLCILPPYILAVHNSCMYISAISSKLPIVEIIYMVLKDTAVAFLLLTYCFIVVNEIIAQKQNVKSDIRKLLVYYIGIDIVYIISCVISIYF